MCKQPAPVAKSALATTMNFSVKLRRFVIAVVFTHVPIVLARADEPIDFQRDIRPILSDRCYVCHGPDEKARQADLRLDVQQAAMHVLSPESPRDSELVARVMADDTSFRMPPPESKLSLTQAEIELLRRWVEQGAPWDRHWSFSPPHLTKPPEHPHSQWPRNAIDRFILEAMERNQLAPSPEASREKLIRRVTFDLTGLPPSLAELDQFLADDSPDAYEKLVDRLLNSTAFGERLASEWLDVARYGDTYGYQVDRDRFVWPWRDWVIRAFNENKPYDQFATEQLAGDLIAGATDDQILATTFNRLHSQKVEGGSVAEEFRVEYVADRTQTFATAFLGLTMECCRCHDHKFDPISQREYYQLFSFFNNIDEAGLYSFFTDSVPTPTLVLAGDDDKRKLAKLAEQVARAEQSLAKTIDEQAAAFERWLNDLAARRSSAAQPEMASGGLVEQADFDQLNLGNNQLQKSGGLSVVELTGDDEIKLSSGNFQRFEPFTICCRIKINEHKERAVIFHRSRAWTDAGSRGYEMLVEDGCLTASLIHFWPGNAISVKTAEPVPVDRWLHVALVYDGSSRADGIRIVIDGQVATTHVVRDRLTKNITGGGQDHLSIGARFRDRGFSQGLISEFRVYDRQLAGIEIRELNEPGSLADLLTSPADRLGEFDKEQLAEFYRLNIDPALAERLNELRLARKSLCELQNSRSEIMVMREMAHPRPAFTLERGVYDRRLVGVSAGTPSVLNPFPDDAPRNRLGLAQWLTDPANPLLSRVTVNRYWQMIFGRGLVQTSEDFGSQGSPPSHPELLDWLSADFVESGWDLKRLLKQIVMSSTYRQNSDVTEDLLRRDPDNIFLARSPAYRLPAEMLRDNALSVSGLLVEQIGGPPVRPYQLTESFKPVAADQGPGLYRRSLYTYWKRTGPAPVLTAFDAGRRDVCRVKRERTSSPLQALVLLNDPQIVEAARKLAERMLVTYPDHPAESVAGEMFRLLSSRMPDDQEVKVLTKLYSRQINHFTHEPEAAEKLIAVGHSQYDPQIEPAQLAAWAVVAHTLMTLDECVVRR